MTEEEAKTRWCPFSRVTVSGYGPELAHQLRGGFKDARCLGSACMAWRWLKRPIEDEKIRSMHAFPDGDGFCGLAGRP